MTIKVNAKTITIVVLAALVLLGGFISPLYIGTYGKNFLHIYALPLIILAVGAVASFVWFLKSDSLASLVPVVLGIIGAIGFGTYGSYLESQMLMGKSTIVVDDKLGNFDERTAWDIAKNRVSSDKGDLVGSAKSPRYLPEEGVFTSLVESNKFTGGYVGVIEQTITADGATSARTCEVTGDSARLGGWFGGKLERQIAKEQTGLRIASDDAYGYCDGEGDEAEAVVVVPLKKLTGFFPVTEVAAGAAVITDGQLDIVESIEAGEIPGPVYPTSLAARQRESLKAHDASFWTWMRGKAGYEDASTEKGDPNSENPTEISLNGINGDTYVSPMTMRPKQDQPRISAYAVVESGHVTAGQYNELVLHVVPKDERREANGVVVDLLKDAYSEADYGWAQGLKVFEMVPTGSDEWVASLGFEKAVKYRVRLAADGSSCIEDADGNKIRCVDATGSVISDETDTDGETSAETPVGEIGTMSNKELAELQDAVTSEMLRRLEADNAAE